MSDDRTVVGSDRVVVVEQAPELVYVERERPAQESHETTIIRSNDRGGLGSSMLVALAFGFLLVVGLVYTMAAGGDEQSGKNGLNLSVDVAAPELPTVTLPDVNVDLKTPNVELPDLKRSDAPAAKTDTAIAPGEPLELVEPANPE